MVGTNLSTMEAGSLDEIGNVIAFFDPAGSSRPSDAVIQRQLAHFRLEQKVGGYTAAELAKPEIENTRSNVGSLIGVPGDRVALGESSTVLWSRALSLLPLRQHSKIIVTSYEYGSNLLSLAALSRRRDIEIKIIPMDMHGQVDLKVYTETFEAEDHIDLVALCHSPTSRGIRLDIEPLITVAKAHESWILVDACQSVGQLPTKWLGEMSDVIVSSGRKFIGGPRGTAFLGASEKFLSQATPFDADISGARLDPEFGIHVESAIGLLERWEGNVAGQLGLGTAAHEAELGTELAGIQREAIEYLRLELSSIQDLTVRDAPDVNYHTNALTFTHARYEAAPLVSMFRRAGAIISDVETYTAPLDLPPRVGRDVNRVSVCRATTSEDVDNFLRLTRQLLECL